MTIKDNRDLKAEAFCLIHRVGVIFDYAGDIYMAIEEVQDEQENYYNAVCLIDGELYHFDTERVQVVNNATLEIS